MKCGIILLESQVGPAPMTVVHQTLHVTVPPENRVRYEFPDFWPPDREATVTAPTGRERMLTAGTNRWKRSAIALPL
jgi:hypothetical protein